jgi:hypothetical protein
VVLWGQATAGVTYLSITLVTSLYWSAMSILGGPVRSGQVTVDLLVKRSARYSRPANTPAIRSTASHTST